MSSDGSPRPLRMGASTPDDTSTRDADSPSPGDSPTSSVYVHIPVPHWRTKPQPQALHAERKTPSPPKTWCTVAPLLSSPVQTSWHMLLTPSYDCSKTPPLVALATMTSASDFEGRQIVRDTWGARSEVNGQRIFLLFVLGTVSSSKVQKAVEDEAEKHKDLLQHSAPDKYTNLALKTATIIEWMATSCPEAKFVLKADTDTLVNLDLMVPYLKQLEFQRDLALGVRIDNMPLVLNPKSRNYQDPLVYPRPVFPPYLSGACYVVSGDLIKKLVHVLPEVHRARNEDTFLGMCLERLGIEPRNTTPHAPINPWFDISKGPCAAFRLAAAHPIKRDLMLAMWTWWHSGGSKICK
ncbi:hypothetical protein Esti_000946 [Eimeria stiedai]